ncbi:MAG: Host attach family protein [Chlamydiales bacterium]|nr:Host attach family protein [Chlamydiales bacterium]
MLTKKNTYVLVANSSLARIFKAPSAHALNEVKTLSHPESRLHARELVSDKPGRSFENGAVTRHAMEPKHSPTENEHQHFAQEVCRYLEKEHIEGSFNHLYVLAAPSFLGLIRQNLNDTTAKTILGSIAKDVTKESEAAIISQIDNFVV